MWIAEVPLDVLIGDARAPHVHDPEETPTPERPTNGRADTDEQLTAGQRPVFHGLIHGLSEGEIAETLELSYHTVHTHVQHIYRAYGVSSRRELMARLLAQAAQRQGAV